MRHGGPCSSAAREPPSQSCILILVCNNHFDGVDRGAADRVNLGHARPRGSEGRRTHPGTEPEQLPGLSSPHHARTGQCFTQEVEMGQEPTFVGIDVAKAQVDVAVRPTGQRWKISYDEVGVRELGSVDICIILSICQASSYLQNSGQRYWSSFAASPACTSDRKLIVSDSSRLSSG